MFQTINIQIKIGEWGGAARGGTGGGEEGGGEGKGGRRIGCYAQS